MKGQLKEHPLAELLREIADRRLSGALRLSHERIKAIVYTEDGEVVAARSNLRAHRLDEALRRWKAVPEEKLSAALQEGMTDVEMGTALISSGAVEEEAMLALWSRLCVEVLRPLLLWTDGEWMFEVRARLEEGFKTKVETGALLVEAARRVPASLAATRLGRDEAALTANPQPPVLLPLAPTEAFVFSRVEGGRLSVGELVSLSGLQEEQSRHIVYTLLVSGLLVCEVWPNVLAGVPVMAASSVVAKETDAAAKKKSATLQADGAAKKEPVSSSGRETSPDAESSAPEEASQPAWNPQAEFEALSAHTAATSLYSLLAIAPDAGLGEIKRAYYSLAKRFHPDRFHKEVDDARRAQIEKAFAKIAHAYEVLKDPKQRAVYDSKLKLASKSSTAKTASASKPGDAPSVHPAAAGISTEYRAEDSFRQGLAALQQNNPQMAIGHLAQAARLMPRNGRYRAYYGQALAHDPRNHRLAESEMLAANSLEPRNATFRIMLAELYLRLNMRTRATAELQRALDADPQNTAARRLLRDIKSTE